MIRLADICQVSVARLSLLTPQKSNNKKGFQTFWCPLRLDISLSHTRTRTFLTSEKKVFSSCYFCEHLSNDHTTSDTSIQREIRKIVISVFSRLFVKYDCVKWNVETIPSKLLFCQSRITLYTRVVDMRKGRIENISKKWSKNLKFFKIIVSKNRTERKSQNNGRM